MFSVSSPWTILSFVTVNSAFGRASWNTTKHGSGACFSIRLWVQTLKFVGACWICCTYRWRGIVHVRLLWMTELRMCFHLRCVVGAVPPKSGILVFSGRDFGCQLFIIKVWLLVVNRKVQSNFRSKNRIHVSVQVWLPVSIRTRI